MTNERIPIARSGAFSSPVRCGATALTERYFNLDNWKVSRDGQGYVQIGSYLILVNGRVGYLGSMWPPDVYDCAETARQGVAGDAAVDREGRR